VIIQSNLNLNYFQLLLTVVIIPSIYPQEVEEARDTHMHYNISNSQFLTLYTTLMLHKLDRISLSLSSTCHSQSHTYVRKHSACSHAKHTPCCINWDVRGTQSKVQLSFQIRRWFLFEGGQMRLDMKTLPIDCISQPLLIHLNALYLKDNRPEVINPMTCGPCASPTSRCVLCGMCTFCDIVLHKLLNTSKQIITITDWLSKGYY
jgi:hypothetical protein